MNRDDKDKSEKQLPSHRVSFARINGQDRQGRDILGPAREIGSIWDRKGKEGHAILRFDHIPEEMRSQNGGVVFVSKIHERSAERAESRPEPCSRRYKGRSDGGRAARDKNDGRDR